MNILQNPSYDPNRLLDYLIDKLKLKNDAALSRVLDVAPPVMSKFRHKRLPIGDSVLVKIHCLTEMRIKDIRVHMGIMTA